MSWLTVAALSLLLAVPAQADKPPLNDDPQVSEREAGASFESLNGAFTLRDFDFMAVGVDDSLFDEFLVHPENMGLRLILGFAHPFGPGSLEMSHTVTTNPGFGTGNVRIPFLGLLNAMLSEFVTLSGGEDTPKLDHDFKPVSTVPEPSTGLMLALGLGAWIGGAVGCSARK